MEAVQLENTKRKDSRSDFNSNLKKAERQIYPAPVLSNFCCVGQKVKVKEQHKQNLRIKKKALYLYLKEMEYVLNGYSKNYGEELIARFLEKPLDEALESRADLTNEVIKKISDLSDDFDLSRPIFKDLFKHKSAYSLQIKKEFEYRQSDFQIFLETNDYFFLYNIDEMAFPQFIRGWLDQYVNFLADKILAGTLHGGFEEAEIERYLAWQAECDLSCFSQEDTPEFKKYLAASDEEKEVMRNTKDSVVNYLYQSFVDVGSFQSESFEEAMSLIVHSFTPKSYYSTRFKDLKDGFDKLCSNYKKAFLDPDSPLHLLSEQLEILGTLNIDDVFDYSSFETMNCSFYHVVIVDLIGKLDASPIGFYMAAQDRNDCCEEGQIRLLIDEDNAVESLKILMICEYFCWQLCRF